MARLTIAFGVVLILLGLGAYFGSGMASVTALIPSFFGVAIALCGGVALEPSRRRGAVIAAGLVGLLGLAGSLSRVVTTLLGGEKLEVSLASGVQAAMAVLTSVFVAVCVWWLARGRATAGSGA